MFPRCFSRIVVCVCAMTLSIPAVCMTEIESRPSFREKDAEMEPLNA